MSEFKLEIFPETKYHKKSILHQAKSLEERYFNNHNLMRREVYFLFKELRTVGFWGVLDMIDGHSNGHYKYWDPRRLSKKEILEEREERRKWARKNFTESELEKILNICVNTALLIPLETSAPGTYRGHSILYEDLVEKEGSIFCEVVDQELHKRLNNGRFWEELPDLNAHLNGGMSYEKIEDILTNNFYELDINFAPKGLEIFYKRRDRPTSFDFNHLSNNAIDNYLTFIRALDEHKYDLKLKFEDLELLVRPYVEAVISYKEKPRFEDFSKRLNEPFILDYIKNSNLIKDEIAKQFELEAEWGSEIGGKKHFLEVLKSLPNQKEVFELIVKEMTRHGMYDLFEFSFKIENLGYSLEPFLNDNTAELLRKSKIENSKKISKVSLN